MRMRFKEPETAQWFGATQTALEADAILSVLLLAPLDDAEAEWRQAPYNAASTPPLPEQRAIAEALSDVDELLGALDRLIAKKRDIKQAAMQQLLTGQTRLPGFNGNWEVKRLGDVATIQRGASPRPIDRPVWFDDNSSVGWVRISDVSRAEMFLLETTQRLSPLGVKYSRPVAADSLIMSICATVGRPIVTKIDVCIHDGFVGFDNLQADQLFLYYVLKWIEPDWSKHGQTGSQMNLNTGLINSTSISLPSLPEQTAIAEVLSDMDAELAALEQRRDKTRLLKQSMMQELLTGRIRLITPSSEERKS
jgi:type I restriction enzyme S subunit